jgi:hypothetical protein
MKAMASITLCFILLFGTHAGAQQDKPTPLPPGQEQQILQKAQERSARQEQEKQLLTEERLLALRRVSDPNPTFRGTGGTPTCSSPPLKAERCGS